MKKREAKWQTIISQYMMEKRKECFYCNYELKQTTTDIFHFSKVPQHQIDSLLAGEREGLHWKYSDQDQRRKPFDGSSNPPLPGYIIIKFPTMFVFISVRMFGDMKRDGFKSISVAMAKGISSRVIHTG